MAQSQLNLYNMALSHAGSKYTLASPSENSIPADICNLWYENVRQTVLRAAHWNCAKRFARLTEEAERDTGADWVSTDPAPGWGFSYEVPENMLYARHMADYSMFDLHYETDQMVINSNMGGSSTEYVPILCFTIDVEDVTVWEPDLYQTIVLGLAAMICAPLTGKLQKEQTVVNKANIALREAQARHLNEHQVRWMMNPTQLQVRGYSFTPTTPYLYPFGAGFSGTGSSTT